VNSKNLLRTEGSDYCRCIVEIWSVRY